ncbi:MAG: hypothetical protein QGF34_07210, partial [Candidatus Poseidoniaceae archaeon]|nr:hypothetical protein [Candidatus Poseidoniaceae archaeon]
PISYHTEGLVKTEVMSTVPIEWSNCHNGERIKIWREEEIALLLKAMGNGLKLHVTDIQCLTTIPGRLLNSL